MHKNIVDSCVILDEVIECSAIIVLVMWAKLAHAWLYRSKVALQHHLPSLLFAVHGQGGMGNHCTPP